ncbi:MAG: hypothetical protein KGL66_00130 [Alphaproteobacteria bacterium]|nr:hypothetical protein [Alphaproteobacteria bacterium]
MTITNQRNKLIAQWRKLQQESISARPTSALDFVKLNQIDEQMEDLMRKIVALD